MKRYQHLFLFLPFRYGFCSSGYAAENTHRGLRGHAVSKRRGSARFANLENTVWRESS